MLRWLIHLILKIDQRFVGWAHWDLGDVIWHTWLNLAQKAGWMIYGLMGLNGTSMGVHGWWDIFWLNYGNSIAWKYLLSYGHLGMIPRILSIIPKTSQWGHYDSCKWMDVNSGDLPQGQVGVLWSALISALLIIHHTLHCRQPRIAISLRFLIVTTNFSIIQESQVWECKVVLNIMLRCYIMIDTGVTKYR
jgi:hypothetical protein